MHSRNYQFNFLIEFVNTFASAIKNTRKRFESKDWNLLLRCSIPSLLALQRVYLRFSFSFSCSFHSSFHLYLAGVPLALTSRLFRREIRFMVYWQDRVTCSYDYSRLYACVPKDLLISSKLEWCSTLLGYSYAPLLDLHLWEMSVSVGIVRSLTLRRLLVKQICCVSLCCTCVTILIMIFLDS